jgi:hypothetical protein
MSSTEELVLKNITLPYFLWYLIPGLNFLIIAVILPVGLIHPSLLADIATASGLIIVAALAVTVGFLFDSLKIYQWTFGYQARRRVTFDAVLSQLGLNRDEAGMAFEVIRVGLPEGGNLGRALALQHSRWVMINHTSKCFFLFCLIWTTVSAVSLYTGMSIYFHKVLLLTRPMSGLVGDALIVALATAVAFRLGRISKAQHELAVQQYILYIRRNRLRLLQELVGDAARDSASPSSQTPPK